MAKSRGGLEHTAVSQSVAISTRPCIYYGCIVHNATTAGVQVKIFDATATAQGNLTDVVTVAAGTNNNQGAFYSPGIIMHSGIYLSAIVCTTASDNVIIFYGGL